MKYDALVALVEEGKKQGAAPPPSGIDTICNGVHVSRFDIPRGTIMLSHCHVFDHVSILAKGRVELLTERHLKVLEGPVEVVINANVKHGLHALTDTVWYCIHAGAPEVRDAPSLDR